MSLSDGALAGPVIPARDRIRHLCRDAQIGRAVHAVERVDEVCDFVLAVGLDVQMEIAKQNQWEIGKSMAQPREN